MSGLLAIICSGLLSAGCSSPSPAASAEKKPDKADRVEVLLYDNAQRSATSHLDIYETEQPTRPNKVIALLTCEGAVDQEVVMTRAIFWRAKQIGADAVVAAGTVNATKDEQVVVVKGWGGSVGGGTRAVFRARAIIYTDK